MITSKLSSNRGCAVFRQLNPIYKRGHKVFLSKFLYASIQEGKRASEALIFNCVCNVATIQSFIALIFNYSNQPRIYSFLTAQAKTGHLV